MGYFFFLTHALVPCEQLWKQFFNLICWWGILTICDFHPKTKSKIFLHSSQRHSLHWNLGESSKKKREKSGQADRLGGGSPPSSLTASILWKFWPILSIIKWQNNPKYDNLSRNFYIFLTASGEGGEGSTQAVSLTAFFPFFFWWFPLFGGASKCEICAKWPKISIYLLNIC